MRVARLLAIGNLLLLVAACGSGLAEECQYPPQFRIDGVVYVGSGTKISERQLAERVGTVTRPDGADGCEPFTLEDGEGLLGTNSVIYTVRGFEPTVALAVVDSEGQQPLMYRAAVDQP